MIDGRPFGKGVGLVCFVTRTAVSFTRGVRECPMIMTVKITLSLVPGAGGALRHKGIPPALVCGSLGSVIPSPVSGEAGHPASSVDQQEDRGLFQHPPKHRWHLDKPEQPQCITAAPPRWLIVDSTHKPHTKGLSPSGFWTLCPSNQILRLWSPSVIGTWTWNPSDLQALAPAVEKLHGETMVAHELTVVRALPRETAGNSAWQECRLGCCD